MACEKQEAAVNAGFDMWFDACMGEENLNDMYRTVSMQAYEDRAYIVESVLDADAESSAAALLCRVIRAEAARKDVLDQPNTKKQKRNGA